jgi:hypothetical protein
MKRNILIVALLTCVTAMQVEAVSFSPSSTQLEQTPAKEQSFVPNTTPKDGTAKAPSEAKKVDSQAKRAICNEQEIKKKPNTAPIYFEARVIFISQTIKATVKELLVACEAATGKTAARVALEVPKPTPGAFDILGKVGSLFKKSADTILLKEQTTKCKVSDKRVSFILNSKGDALQVVCGEEKKTTEDIGNTYTPPPHDTSNSNDTNNNGIPDEYDKSAQEAAAQGDMSQPSSQGTPYNGQGLPKYNPYEYQYADGLYSEGGELSTDELLYGDDGEDYHDEEEGYGGQIADWRGETGTEGGKADSDDFYNPLLDDTEEFSDDEYLAYDTAFYVTPDTSIDGIQGILQATNMGISPAEYALWDAEQKATRDGWTPLDVSYGEYQEYYGGTLTRSQWDNWYARLINPTDFEYNPGIDSPNDSETNEGFFTKGWGWLVSWFKGVNPTNKYYEI